MICVFGVLLCLCACLWLVVFVVCDVRCDAVLLMCVVLMCVCAV